jgi:predicted amidophosphoribosyltransferase
MSECDLCNEKRHTIAGTFYKRSDHGSLVALCNKCWGKLDSVDERCCLCSGDVPDDPKRRHTITQNQAPEHAASGSVCSDCRRMWINYK